VDPNAGPVRRGLGLAAVAAAVAFAGSCDESGSSRTDAADASGALCNGATCAAGERCIHPCCGGAPPVCEPVPEAGTCPEGTIFLASCPPVLTPACQRLCNQPPSYCSATIPVGCIVDSRGEVVCQCA
jgi:hypothetical protein